MSNGAWASQPEAGPHRRHTPVAELFERTFSLYRRNLAPMLLLYAVIEIPIAALSLPLTALEARWSSEQWQNSLLLQTGVVSLPALRDQLLAGSLLTLLVFLLSLSLGTLAFAAITHVAYRSSRGERPTLNSAVDELRGSSSNLASYILIVVVVLLVLAATLGSLLLWAVLTSAASNFVDLGPIVVLALIGLVVFAGLCIVGVRLAVSIPALVIEHIGGVVAMRRSWALVRGRTVRTLGCLLLVGFALGLLGGIIPQLIPGLYGGLATGSFASYLGLTLVGGVIGTVLGPIFPILLTVLYLDYAER